MQKSACFTSALPRLELQKTACAQETARRTATDARSARLAEDGEFAAEKLPQPAWIRARAQANSEEINRQQPWPTRSPPTPRK